MVSNRNSFKIKIIDMMNQFIEDEQRSAKYLYVTSKEEFDDLCRFNSNEICDDEIMQRLIIHGARNAFQSAEQKGKLFLGLKIIWDSDVLKVSDSLECNGLW